MAKTFNCTLVSDGLRVYPNPDGKDPTWYAAPLSPPAAVSSVYVPAPNPVMPVMSNRTVPPVAAPPAVPTLSDAAVVPRSRARTAAPVPVVPMASPGRVLRLLAVLFTRLNVPPRPTVSGD